MPAPPPLTVELAMRRLQEMPEAERPRALDILKQRDPAIHAKVMDALWGATVNRPASGPPSFGSGALIGVFLVSIDHAPADSGLYPLITHRLATVLVLGAVIVGMALLVILVKGLILYGLGTLFKLQGRDRWLFALGLAQAGEFGFVLVSFSVATGVMPNDVAETLLLVVALSMLITPLLFITYDQISKRMDTKSGPIVADEIDEQGTVIIAGVGRFGQIVNRLVQASGFRTVVLDHNPETIAVMRRFGFKAFLGDPTRADILRKAGLRDAKVLVVALDDPKSALQLIAYARKERPDLHIVTRAHDRTDVYQQYQAGANDIVREMFDSSLRAGRYVLENLGLSDYEAAEAQRMFYSHDRASVRELAALWRPDIPPSENKAYVARAKELQKDLETAFLNRIDQEDKTQGS